jgi:hypothetical protein
MKHELDREANGSNKEIRHQQQRPEEDEVQSLFFVSKDIVDVFGDIRESMHGHQFTQNFTLTIHRKASRIPGEKIFFARLEAVSL